MISNIFRLAVRKLIRQRLYSFLNLFGFCLALSSVFLISLYVKFELSYDRHYSDYDRIYRINTVWNGPEGDEKYATSPPPLADVLRSEIPEISQATRLYKWSDFTLRPDSDSSNVFRETNLYWADEYYFQVFGDQLIAGDPATALQEPVCMVLTESMARRYFGSAVDLSSLVGRLVLGGKDAGTPWRITGIMRDVPVNSHMDFDGLVSSITLRDIHFNSNWTWNLLHTYVVIDDQSVPGIPGKFEDLVRNHVMPHLGVVIDDGETSMNGLGFVLQPISDIHLKSSYFREMTNNGSITNVRAFGIVAVLLLIIGSVNYVNLAMVQSLERSREIGIRKVMGTGNSLLLLQLLAEPILLSVIAAIFSMGIVELFIINFGGVLGIHFDFDLINDWGMTLIFLGLGGVIGALSGALPAFRGAALSPATALKGSGGSYRPSRLRNGLILLQFFISGGFIICAGVVNQQLDFMRTKNLGFNKENVIVIQNDREIEEQRSAFLDRLREIPTVQEAGFTTALPGLLDFQLRDISLEGGPRQQAMQWAQIDPTYPRALNMKLKEGRWFDAQRASDSTAVIVNEKAAASIAGEFQGQGSLLGKWLVVNQGANDEHQVQVIGVVEDFNSESFYEPVKPVVLEYLHGYSHKDYVAIRISQESEVASIGAIREAWNLFEPDVPMSYFFLDDTYDALFRQEEKITTVLDVFSALSMLVACLGLFGLTAYTTSLKSQEIGIRKVLGASVLSVVFLLSRNFALLAMFGFLFAAPVAWIAMTRWLERFAFRVNFDPLIIVWAGLGLITLSIVTVSIQAIRAALVNPVDSLKEE